MKHHLYVVFYLFYISTSSDGTVCLCVNIETEVQTSRAALSHARYDGERLINGRRRVYLWPVCAAAAVYPSAGPRTTVRSPTASTHRRLHPPITRRSQTRAHHSSNSPARSHSHPSRSHSPARRSARRRCSFSPSVRGRPAQHILVASAACPRRLDSLSSSPAPPPRSAAAMPPRSTVLVRVYVQEDYVAWIRPVRGGDRSAARAARCGRRKA